MYEVNQALLDFFTSHFKPGDIGFVGMQDKIGHAIRRGQVALNEGKPSLWSHCFIMGEKRLDCRNNSPIPVSSPYIFESHIVFNLEHLEIQNGAQENWLGKWSNVRVEHAAVIDFNLDFFQTQLVLASAVQMIGEDVLFPIGGLFYTWLALQMNRFGFSDPLASPKRLFCSAFVRKCYQQAGVDFMGSDIPLWNTTPEHIAQIGKDRMIMWK
jgi:hypothetical protein